jgi:hypothetical protein
MKDQHNLRHFSTAPRCRPNALRRFRDHPQSLPKGELGSKATELFRQKTSIKQIPLATYPTLSPPGSTSLGSSGGGKCARSTGEGDPPKIRTWIPLITT